jgi:hypothetical protein
MDGNQATGEIEDIANRQTKVISKYRKPLPTGGSSLCQMNVHLKADHALWCGGVNPRRLPRLSSSISSPDTINYDVTL